MYGGEPIHGSEIWDPYFYVLHTSKMLTCSPWRFILTALTLTLYIDTRQWSRVRTKGRLPSERAGHSTCVSDDGIMYIFGGHFQRKYLNDLCAFNVKECECGWMSYCLHADSHQSSRSCQGRMGIHPVWKSRANAPIWAHFCDLRQQAIHVSSLSIYNATHE